jgi:uncharacterized protein (UPF0276 family)
MMTLVEAAMPPGLRRAPATVRGASFSCDPVNDMAVAEAVAARVRDAATWYSIGVLSENEALAQQFIEFCDRHGFHRLFHAIDLDICGTDPLDREVLRNLAARANEIDPPWVNIDLAMWCRRGEPLLEGMIPMPLIPEAVPWAVDRIKQVQDALQRPISIENGPYPFMIGDGDILQLMHEIAAQADCLIALDIGHLHGLRVQRKQPLLSERDTDLDWSRVVEVHMSGSFVDALPDGEIGVADRHDMEVHSEVFDLFLRVLPLLTNVRAVMCEAEGLPADELARSVLRVADALHLHWSAR